MNKYVLQISIITDSTINIASMIMTRHTYVVIHIIH